MSVLDPSLPLQKAILARLNADAGVSAIVAGRIYDGVPTNAVKPYVSFGSFQVLPEAADCSEGAEVSITLDGWATGPSTVTVKRLGAAIAKSLRWAEMSLDEGQRLVVMDIESVFYMRDPDGITAHAVVTVRALAEPLVEPDPVPPSGGFPDATTAGVQAGISLTPRGDWDITAPGTWENFDVTGYVVINANNVTLRNCRVRPLPGQVGACVYVSAGKTGVVIEYCDIDGLQAEGLKGVWCDDSVGTVIRFNDIRFCEDGIYVTSNNHQIRDNYIHDLISAGADPHHDNLQIGGIGTGIIIDHNTLIGAADANAILQFGNAGGNVSVTINNNLMRPGPVMLCLLNLGDAANGNTVIWNVTNNHMEPGHHGAGAQFGYATWNVNPPTTWTGNVNADTGASIPAPTK